VLAQKN